MEVDAWALMFASFFQWSKEIADQSFISDRATCLKFKRTWYLHICAVPSPRIWYLLWCLLVEAARWKELWGHWPVDSIQCQQGIWSWLWGILRWFAWKSLRTRDRLQCCGSRIASLVGQSIPSCTSDASDAASKESEWKSMGRVASETAGHGECCSVASGCGNDSWTLTVLKQATLIWAVHLTFKIWTNEFLQRAHSELTPTLVPLRCASQMISGLYVCIIGIKLVIFQHTTSSWCGYYPLAIPWMHHFSAPRLLINPSSQLDVTPYPSRGSFYLSPSARSCPAPLSSCALRAMWCWMSFWMRNTQRALWRRQLWLKRPWRDHEFHIRIYIFIYIEYIMIVIIIIIIVIIIVLYVTATYTLW